MYLFSPELFLGGEFNKITHEVLGQPKSSGILRDHLVSIFKLSPGAYLTGFYFVLGQTREWMRVNPGTKFEVVSGGAHGTCSAGNWISALSIKIIIFLS